MRFRGFLPISFVILILTYWQILYNYDILTIYQINVKITLISRANVIIPFHHSRRTDARAAWSVCRQVAGRHTRRWWSGHPRGWPTVRGSSAPENRRCGDSPGRCPLTPARRRTRDSSRSHGPRMPAESRRPYSRRTCGVPSSRPYASRMSGDPAR